MEENKHLIDATCPECRGPLSEIRYNGLTEYKCLVGHRYSAESLLAAHSQTQEKALWGAIVALEEATNIVHAVSALLAAGQVRRLEDLAATKHDQAQEIRRIVEKLEPFRIG